MALGLSFSDAPRALNVPGCEVWGLDSCRMSCGWLGLCVLSLCVPGLLLGCAGRNLLSVPGWARGIPRS